MKAPSLKTILIGALVIMCLLALLSWRSACTAADQARDQATLGDARTNSAHDAIQTQDDVAQEKSAITDKVETGVDAIHNARSPADRNDAALRSLCNVDPSASPDCRLLQPRP